MMVRRVASAKRQSVRAIAPNEQEQEETLLKKLGARGWGRVHYFRDLFQAGWGEHGGAPMSPRAFEAFVRFVRAIDFPVGNFPSVFISDRGGIELCWEDSKGSALQVEFVRDGAEYYIEASGQEGFLSHSDYRELQQIFSD